MGQVDTKIALASKAGVLEVKNQVPLQVAIVA